MFYPVRIFNRKGLLKRELSTEQLSRLYWKRFFDQEQGGRSLLFKTRKKRDNSRGFLWKRTLPDGGDGQTD